MVTPIDIRILRRVASGCNGYFDAAAGKRLGQSLADMAEADSRA